MRVESYGPTQVKGVAVPRRVFIRLTGDEAAEAIRRYCCDEGLEVPGGRRVVLPAEDGYVLMVESIAPQSPPA